MHAAFFVYGKRDFVEYFLRQIEAQKMTMKLWRDNPETGKYEEAFDWVELQVRICPGGIYEVIFPKEHKDLVLTTLEFNRKGKGKPLGENSSIEDYGLDKEISKFGFKIKPFEEFKKLMRYEDPGEFKTESQLIWFHPFVSIIPIGIRHELGDVKNVLGPWTGWWHEGI